MKAIRTREPAGISGLAYEEVPDPTPMIGDVLVQVAACGITHHGVYPLADAVRAYTAKAAGGIPGRIVLQP